QGRELERLRDQNDADQLPHRQGRQDRGRRRRLRPQRVAGQKVVGEGGQDAQHRGGRCEEQGRAEARGEEITPWVPPRPVPDAAFLHRLWLTLRTAEVMIWGCFSSW